MNSLAIDVRVPSPVGSLHRTDLRQGVEDPPSSVGAVPDLLECILESIERLSSGLAIVDGCSQLLYANSAARRSIMHAGWSVENGLLKCRSSHEQATWAKALHEVFSRRQRHLFDMVAPGSKSFAALVPISFGDAPRVLVTFGRGELCGTLELQLFAAQHGLTLAESHVLRKLSQGLRPAQIAADHGVALTTVVTQVAAVRAKTGVGSVRQLLNVLSRLPPVQPALTGFQAANA